MQSGVIGLSQGRYSDLVSFRQSRRSKGFEVNRGIDVRRTIAGPGDSSIFTGTGGIQKVEETETAEFGEDSIFVQRENEKKTYHSEFVAVSSDFVVVENSAGMFLFDLIENQTGIETNRAEIDLYSFLGEFDGHEAWKVGFEDRDGLAENGVVYGEDLFNDSDIGDILINNVPNQIGIQGHEHNGTEYKYTLTKSGYFEIYNPSELPEEEVVDFIRSKVIPFASVE